MTTTAPTLVGFSTPIVTTADQSPVLVVGLGAAPRLREGKATPQGEATYASQTILLGSRDGQLVPMKTASVHVIEPAAVYELGVRYRATGRVYCMPYVPDGGRLTWSITVERLVPVED